MELSYRAGFSIDWSRTSKDGYLSALSDEIREPAKGHLDNYLRPYIIDIHHRNEWPAIIGGIRGLDGLDKENIGYGSVDDPLIKQNYKGYQTPSQ
jgi:cell filamentation protein